MSELRKLSNKLMEICFVLFASGTMIKEILGSKIIKTILVCITLIFIFKLIW